MKVDYYCCILSISMALLCEHEKLVEGREGKRRWISREFGECRHDLRFVRLGGGMFEGEC
jgi:hypothetical protein